MTISDRLHFMDLNSLLTPKIALLSTTVFFFLWLLVSLVIGPLVHLVISGANSDIMLSIGSFLTLFISFIGSCRLLVHFGKTDTRYLIWILPFSIVTGCGFTLSAIVLFPGSMGIPLLSLFPQKLLLFFISLLLIPAMTILLAPFIQETKKRTGIAIWFLGILNALAIIFLGLLFTDSILPLLDPEFIASSLWDFESPDVLLSISSALFIFFGSPAMGIFSLLFILEYSQENHTVDGAA